MRDLTHIGNKKPPSPREVASRSDDGRSNYILIELSRQSQIVLVGQSLHGAVSLQLVKGGIHSCSGIAALAEATPYSSAFSSSTIFRLA